MYEIELHKNRININKNPLLNNRGITLIFASVACMASLILAASIVTAAYGSYKRSVYNYEERRRELYAASGVNLLRDGLEGETLTLTTLTVIKDGAVITDEAIDGEAGYSAGGWVQRLLEGAYTGGGTVSMSAAVNGNDIVWICDISGLAKDSTGLPDLSQPFNIDIVCSAEGEDICRTLKVYYTASIDSSSITHETEADGETHIQTFEYKVYTYTFGRGDIF